MFWRRLEGPFANNWQLHQGATVKIIYEEYKHQLLDHTLTFLIHFTFSSIDLLLERLCLEGSRKQAKYSVQALAAITKDDGLKSLSVLYKVT